MSTPDTNNIGIKLQAAGENLNTWGDPNLNNDLTVLSHIGSNWKALTFTGDYTVSETNYATTNDTENATLKAGGTPAAASNFVLPNRAKRFVLWNNTGVTITPKLAATSGFSLPTGRWTIVATDGSTDVYNMAPNYLGTGFTPTNLGDATNVQYVQNAIATASLPATAGTILNSGADTTAGYASTKITALTSGGLVRSTLNAGANEQNQFALDFTNLTVTTNIVATDRFAVYDATAAAMRYQTRANVVGKYGLILQADQTSGFTAAAGNLYPCDFTSAGFLITMPASASRGDVIGISVFGTSAGTFSTNSLLYYGTAYTALPVMEGVQFFYYSGATRGWIDI